MRGAVMRILTPIILTTIGINFTVAESATPPTYERDIRPIFRAHCFDCHGATDELKGALDLRLVRFIQKGGESGPAISLGAPNKSFLLETSGTRLSDLDEKAVRRFFSEIEVQS